MVGLPARPGCQCTSPCPPPAHLADCFRSPPTERFGGLLTRHSRPIRVSDSTAELTRYLSCLSLKDPWFSSHPGAYLGVALFLVASTKYVFFSSPRLSARLALNVHVRSQERKQKYLEGSSNGYQTRTDGGPPGCTRTIFRVPSARWFLCWAEQFYNVLPLHSH